MNKKYLIVGLVLLVLVMPSLVLAEEYEAHCISDGDAQEVGVQCWPKIPSFSCPFEEKEGRIIVEFNNRMRADKGWSFAHELVSAHIPKGTYKVSLSSFDGYIGRRNVVQHYEQWYAVLMRSTSQYDTITATNFIHDVPDPSNKDYASITMKVNDLLIVPEDASYVMAVHSYFGHPIIKGPESLDPICAAFDRISDNTVYCPDADMIFDVHMSVVSEAHHSKKTTDSTIIDIPMQGSHVVKGVVERGNPGQCQTGEEFYMEINGITGHVVEDDIEPCAMNTTLEYLGTYYFGMGGNIVYMHSTNDTSSSNSVSLNQLCLYYDDDVLCPFEIGDFCTQSQGGWGSPSNSGPGSMRDNNWDYVIGGSLIVGIGYNMTFTGPEYVKDYLPEGGTPSSLTQSYTNPDSSQTNVFAGQVTALKLNVLYSDAGIGLITPGLDVSIGELYVKYGKFEGITVYQLLDIAEKVLGGDNSVLSPYSASVSDLNDAVSKVNENFVDCNVDKGYLEWLTCEDDPVLGSITFCKELLDPQGSLSDGNGLDVSFRLNTSLGFVDWALPLSYDDGLDCVLFDELVLGSYYYDAEIINNYEDMIFWYGALYSLDGGPLVDYSDGLIVLSEEYPDRTLVVRNKYGVVPVFEPIVIKAYKIVCEDESYLPDWGLAVNPLKPTQITPAVIESFVSDSEGYCWYEEDWDFQYGFDVVKLPGDHVGYALESDGAGYWKNFTSTTTGFGPAVGVIPDLEGYDRIWVREVLKEGYLPFANPPGDLQDSYSAEFYCHKDILNFDNYDRIDNPVMGGTYYCVGFNTLIPVDPVLGSINVCKRVLDENGTVISGVGLNTTFTVPMMGLDDAVFSTPLSYDSYDVECLLYDELELGDYVFGSEVIDGPDNVKWLSPYYEPVYGDNTISLTLDSPDRTLLVVNQIDEIIVDPVLGSITFCKELLDPQGSLSDGSGLDVSFRLNTSLGFVDWALPLSYENGLDCEVFDELVLGSYYYDAEIINNYEDMIFWYGALYSLDGGPLVDYSDGTIVLSEEYPDRTLVVRNKYGVVPEPEPVTIKAYKIVCEDESYLPDWGLAVNPLKPTQITPAVIESFLEDNEGYCWYEEDWDFQYGFDVVKLPGDHVGYALESDGAGYWKNFTSTTTVDGPAIVTISDLEGFNRIWVREVLQEGYLPFANPPGDLQDSYSAEFYCHKDILNFDNYDRIDNPVMGGTYYCVGFNTPIPDDPVLGSINVCKRVLDENGTVISGVGLNTTFTVPMMGLDDAVFSTPLSYDSYDVECLLYDELELGDYVFGSEVIDGPDNVKWLSPYYEPVYGDYTISLTLDSPDRTLLVVNQIDEIIIVESFRGSITFCKQLLDENGVIIDGEGLDVSFMLNTSLGMITYDMPLSYYDDADCITYYNLTLQEYYYDPESILSNEHLLVWEEPLYGLDGNTPVLYDNGMILLDEDNRNRTLLIINQYDIIDVPVCIDIDYTMPYYNNGSAQWIDTESRVVLNINDSIDACIMADHYYRYHIVSEEYCLNSCSSWAPNYNGNSWSEYEGPFPLGVEACYVIEYYTDSPGNVDDTIMWDCIFMDKTLPTINKEVGHYKSYWDGTSSPYYPEAPLHCGENGGSECWEVTLSTPITISCADEGYYPSGVSKMCFIIEFNGDDVTQDYCGIYDGEMDDGQCCLSGDSIVMNFQKESWHKLSLTCTDNVGKQSSSVQYYKVGGKTFEIVLNKKWNLISIPIALSDNSIESIFEGHENSIAAIWAFDGKNWMVWSPEGPNSLTHMHPGWGYWVLATDDINITVGGSLMNPAVTPPAKTIVEGWNLIGYYGMEGAPMNSYGLKYYNGPNIYGDGMSSYCALSTLLSNAWDTPLPSLWTYWEPNNPQPWIPLNVNAGHYMNPGAGYWLYYSKKGGASYAPSTSCGMPLSTFSV